MAIDARGDMPVSMEFVAGFREFLQKRVTYSRNNNLTSSQLEENEKLNRADQLLSEFYKEWKENHPYD